MTQITSFRAVIDLWPSQAALRRDLETCGRAKVNQWRHANMIPEVWFDDLLLVAKKRGFHEITYRLLTALYRAKGTLPETGSAEG